MTFAKAFIDLLKSLVSSATPSSALSALLLNLFRVKVKSGFIVILLISNTLKDLLVSNLSFCESESLLLILNMSILS